MMKALGFVLILCAAAAQTQPDSKKLATVEGRTLAQDGSPLRKSTVKLRPAMNKIGETPRVYTTASDAEGKFIFDGVEPGSYNLIGQHPGYIQSSYGVRKSRSVPTLLSLTAGQHLREIAFTLIPRALISGRVLDDEGDPVAGCQIQVLQKIYNNGTAGYFTAGSTQSDDEGQFRIASVSPGRYILSANPSRQNYFEATRKAVRAKELDKPDEELVAAFYPGVTDTASAATIEVIAGRNMPGTDIRLRKSSVFHIRGKLAGSPETETGERLRLSLISLDGFLGAANSVMAEKDGAFEMQGVVPGSYTLIAAPDQGDFKVLGRQNIEVGNRNLDDVTLVGQPTGSLRGSLQRERSAVPEASQPALDFSGLRFYLRAAAGISFGTWMIAVKPDGTFVIDDLSPDKYRLNSYGVPDGTYLKSARLGDQDVLADGVDLTGGLGAATLEIVLGSNPGQIDGSVQDDRQQPAIGTQVNLLPDPMDFTRTYLHASANTDQNGRFSIKNIAPGKYRLYAWEEIETGAPSDPEFMKPLESLGTKIAVEENGHHAQTLTRISVAQMDQAKAK